MCRKRGSCAGHRGYHRKGGQSRSDDQPPDLRSIRRTSRARHLRRHMGRPGFEIPNTRGIRNDVVAALKAIKVPNVRWPGGCFADEYHWRNGIGAARSAPRRSIPTGAASIEPNTFGTHEFMDFVQQIGADAYLSVNVGSGTPQEAADWLEYLTTPISRRRWRRSARPTDIREPCRSRISASATRAGAVAAP